MGVEEPSNDYFRDNINMPLNDKFWANFGFSKYIKMVDMNFIFQTGFVNIKGQMSTES